ncbi:MAG: DUF1295 domain-containing protein, partial [Ignavibacteriaceae bacterium]
MPIKLMFKNEYDKSPRQKFIIICILSLAIFISTWLLFFNTELLKMDGILSRKIILVMCSVIYLVRTIITLFVFLKRRITWLEALPISMLMSFVLFGFIYIGGVQTQPINIMDLLGIVLYLTGSYINTSSELDRHRWKYMTENKGHLYTQGLFKHVRHVNYFGDILLFTGFALITQDIRALYPPLFMILNFIFILIPAKEAYLKDKYRIEFEQ